MNNHSNSRGAPPPYSTSREGRTNPAFNGLENGAPASEARRRTKEQESRDRQLQQQEIDDPWAVAVPEDVDQTKWSDLTTGEKILRVSLNLIKFACVLTLLYFFICSLDFLSSAFRLIAGRTTGDVLSNEYMRNPVVGLMIGILVTVLVQSSSTSTSIIVSMVSSSILSVHIAVPMIMGSNIGTSVTNTIVSLTQVGDRNEFRRAFAGATVHDMFNWLTVGVLITIEICFGMLENITHSIMNNFDFTSGGGSKVKILKVITEPFTKKVIKLDKKVLTGWAKNDEHFENITTMVKDCHGSSKCSFLFSDTSLTDVQIGLILLLVSLVILTGSLVLIVKVLNSMMKGSIAVIIKKTINADIPYVPWITGYLAILIGAVMTFIVQSSSIFTSTLTPLIGIGVITVERAYPLTLGSNIGTTTTSLLAALAAPGDTLRNAIQIALVHLLFNIFGIALFFPIPFMRFPIPMAKKLGDTTAKYRWFAVLYLVVMFFIFPGTIFILSLGGPLVMYIVCLPMLILLLLVVLINVIQTKKRSILPNFLQNWDFMPEPLHSLKPYDRLFTKMACCKSCAPQNEDQELEQVTVNSKKGHDNPALESDHTKF